MTSLTKAGRVPVAVPGALPGSHSWILSNSRFLFFVFFAICIFFNQLLDEDRNLYVSHIAMLGLFAVGAVPGSLPEIVLLPKTVKQAGGLSTYLARHISCCESSDPAKTSGFLAKLPNSS